jgi:hypothetical protein
MWTQCRHFDQSDNTFALGAKELTVRLDRFSIVAYRRHQGSTIEGVELVIAGHVDVLAHTSEEADKWDEALSARLKAANVTLIPTLTLFSRDDSFIVAGGEIVGHGVTETFCESIRVRSLAPP